MSRDLNQCNFIGRIGKELDPRYMPNGNAVLNFSIACGDDYKDKQTGEKVEQTNWINIVAYGRTAENLAKYCHKGSRIFISGKQVTRKWQDKDGHDRYTTEIIASEMQMLDGKNSSPDADRGRDEARSSGAGNQAGPAQGGGFDDFDDDIHF